MLIIKEMDDKLYINSRGFYLKLNLNESEVFIKLIRDDLTTQNTNVIVNAANNKLLFGDGIAGAIYKKAGPPINDECKAIMKNRNNKNFENGEVVPTSCGNMQNENLLYIFHGIGPYYHHDTKNESSELRLTFDSCLSLAEASEFSLESISIPPISTGLFGYPIDGCARVFFQCMTDFIKEKISNTSKICLKEIRMCIIDSKTFDIFKEEYNIFLIETKKNFTNYIREDWFIEFGTKHEHNLKKLN